MGKPLSLDLRSRLVAAVAGGMSRRGAAERFGVSAGKQRGKVTRLWGEQCRKGTHPV